MPLINQISLLDDWDDSEKSIKALITFENYDSRWIIDYGVTNHMTFDKSLFQSITPPVKENFRHCK